ncbi:hypothetical protein GCM10027406_25950 [Leifsonia lichenia]
MLVAFLALLAAALVVVLSIENGKPVRVESHDIVGYWSDGESEGARVWFAADGSVRMLNVSDPSERKHSGSGSWMISKRASGDAILVSLPSGSVHFFTGREVFQLVLYTYSGDPDVPGSKHVLRR